MDRENIMERYNNIKRLITKRKNEFQQLMDFQENETDWLKAPASTKFHLCKEGGLLEHSINVAETMLKMKNVLEPNITMKRI